MRDYAETSIMTRKHLDIGSPVLIALMIVAAVSLSARVYHDRALTQQVEASITHTQTVAVDVPMP